MLRIGNIMKLMPLFLQHSGEKCIVDFSDSNSINEKAYGIQECIIDFQCITICDIPGLVYVKFTPKGKRKPRSFTVHQERITLL
jgi:hypothetical protein